MAGGKIIRIVGGIHTIECNTWEVYTEEFSLSSGGKSVFTADKEIIFGVFKEPERETGYFVKGWWSDENNNPIKDARVGDTVRFHIKTKNIESDKKINIQLYEYDGAVHMPISEYETKETRPFDDPITIISSDGKPTTELVVDENGEASISIVLSWGIHRMFNEGLLGNLSEGGILELYFECSYNEEIVYLPVLLTEYLQVRYSKQNLFLQSAAEGYYFPEIRTAEGDILVFNEVSIKDTKVVEEENNEIINLGKEKIKEKGIDILKKGLDKSRRVIAIHQLRKGKLTTNVGSIHWRKKIYHYTDFINSGEAVRIQRASHMGWIGPNGKVTTKGISQLDYFSNKGVYNGIAKVAKEFLNVLDFVDLVRYLSGNGRPESIFAPLPAVSLIANLLSRDVINNIKDWEENITNQLLEAAKDMGIKGIKEFVLLKGNLDENGNKRYNYMEINLNIYNQLMRGEIKTLSDLNKQIFIEKRNMENDFNITLFWKWHKDIIINDDIILIETIFFNY